MIIYLYGEDSYRRNLKLRELIAAYREKQKNTDFFSVDFEEDPEGWEKAREFLGQPSMFTNSKLLLVRENGSLGEKERKAWKKVLRTELASPKTFVIISDRRRPLKDFQFLLEKPVRYQYFGALKGRELSHFLTAEAFSRGLKFERSAWNFFINYLSAGEETSWQGINELEKIALARFRSPVTTSDIQSLIRSAELGPVFKVARDFLVTRNYKKKFMLLELVLLHGEEAAYLFNSLAFQAKGKALLRLADYDIKIKSGNADYEEALTEFAIQ